MATNRNTYLLFGSLILSLVVDRHGTVSGFLLGQRSIKFPILHRKKSRNISLSATSSSSSSSLTNIPVLDPLRSPPEGVEVLSTNPLVYRVPNLLSEQQCQGVMDRAKSLEETRPMKLSNPPEVSLRVEKLWPLAILSILAGVPPLIRYCSNQETNVLPTLLASELLPIVLPPILGAFVGSLVLAYGVVLPLIKQFSNTSARTSVAMALNEEDDIPFVYDLVERVSNATKHPWEKFEAPVFTRYAPGAIFARHSDASPTRGSEWADEGGQRVVTCICYLNTVTSGGETAFDKLGISVRPVQGSALVFFPTVPGESLDSDERLTHESMPSVEEEKYIVQMFGRVGPRVPPPLGLPDSFGTMIK
eukprot:scaffold3103_cov136-Cylindrotheca_fusiformis.AAC.32